LGSSAFARRYLRNVLKFISLFSFPLATEMFHFTRYAQVHLMCTSDRGLLCRVSPFGNLRVSLLNN